MALCVFLAISVAFGSHCVEEGLSNTQLVDQARLDAVRNDGGDDDIKSGRDMARVHRLQTMMMVAEQQCELKLGFCIGSRLYNVYLDECVCSDLSLSQSDRPRMKAPIKTTWPSNKTQSDGNCDACLPVPDCAVSTECDELASLAKAVIDATDVPSLKGPAAGNYSAFEWPTKEGHVRNCVSQYSHAANKLREFGSQGRLDPLLGLMALIRGCSPLLHQVELISGPGSAIWTNSNPHSSQIRDPIFSKGGFHTGAQIRKITRWTDSDSKQGGRPTSVIKHGKPKKEG